MRWREPLDEILGSRAKVRILRALWATDGEALSGREIARRVGLSHTGVLRALAELETEDVVWPSSDPTGTRYRLNRTHEFVRDGLRPLFAMEASLEDRLVGYVREAVPDAISIVMFGSVARGDDAPTSDVDVLVVVPDGVDPHDAADRVHAMEFYARLGKVLEAIVWTESELRRNYRDGMRLVASVAEDGKTLFGPSVRQLLIGVARVAE